MVKVNRKRFTDYYDNIISLSCKLQTKSQPEKLQNPAWNAEQKP